MKLTLKDIAKHYEGLLGALPFCEWEMPERVVFKITKNKNRRGYFRPLPSGWVIAISEDNHKTHAEVQATVAHEMIHAHLEMRQYDGPDHGEEFHRLADEVCEYFGFNREIF